jgi:hypothetical protein
MRTAIALAMEAVFVLAAISMPNPAGAAPGQRCCIWDPNRAFTCLMYCPGGGTAAPTATAQPPAKSTTKLPQKPPPSRGYNQQ